MSGKKSRNKGARGEREAAKYLRGLGFDAQRNARNGISTDDLHLPGLPNVCVEVKYGYASMDLHAESLRKAWEQCDVCAAEKFHAAGRRDATSAGLWSIEAVVLWKPPRKPWRLTWMDGCGLVTTTGDDAIKAQLLNLNGKGT